MNTRKKILLLGDINSIHLQKWILGLKEDFQITVFSLDPIEEDQDCFGGVTIYTNDKKTTNKQGKLSYLKSIRRFRKLHKDLNPDFVHSHYATSYGLIGKLLNPNNFFISVWGSDVYEFPLKSFFHKTVLKWILNRADKLFSTSENMKVEAQKYTSNLIDVIPFGVDLHVFKPLNEKKYSGEFVIGTVKTLEKIYGIDRLIKSFSNFNKIFPNSKCLIYGRGSQELMLKELVADLGLQEVVEFRGFISHDEVPEVMAEFDVFCMLSLQESFGVAALEAAACGIPVIGSNVGGIPEVIENNVTGYLVDSIEEASKKMVYLSENPGICLKMKKNALDMVQEKYDWNKNLKLMTSHYLS